MNICILGKYPPLEGGVSTNTYWLARGLAERGHGVHVITNADETEAMYRMTLGPDDEQWYEPQFPTSGGRVHVLNPERYSRRRMGHIPEANPFVTKLASLATDVVRQNQCELIFAYYFEPYAVAASLAAHWTGRPLICKHAGSDLDRLMRLPDLATAYKEILCSAHAVVTQPRLMPRFLGMGVSPDRLQGDIRYGIPTAIFNAAAEPMDVAPLALDKGHGWPAPFDATLPTIGVYGKIGPSKGTFDLIAALGQLARTGRQFNFLAMIGRAQGEIIAGNLESEGLCERSYVIEMVPNWRVPNFLRRCTAVCFLERDFPVEIHGPIIPREALACATCLVLSGEIASKQFYREALSPGDNFLVVEDPRRQDELAATLATLLDDPALARHIGERGAQITASIEDHKAYIDQWEALLLQSVAPRMPVRPHPPREAVDVLNATIPDLLRLLQQRTPSLVAGFLLQAKAAPARTTAEAFCTYVETRLAGAACGDDLPRLRDLLRYARCRAWTLYDAADDPAPFPVVDRLADRPVTLPATRGLRPAYSSAARIEEFDHKVAMFAGGAMSAQPVDPEDDPVTAFMTLAPTPSLILFLRRPNLSACELAIDEPTRQLLDACDGSRTTAALVDWMCASFGADSASERELLTERLLAALDRLYRLGVLVFAETRLDGRWHGGLRTGKRACDPD